MGMVGILTDALDIVSDDKQAQHQIHDKNRSLEKRERLFAQARKALPGGIVPMPST